MDCRNCGAPMELFERRRYYHCRHCGSFHFIETGERDGVRVLVDEPRSAPSVTCPLCREPLKRALLDDAYPVDHCERCRGLLMPRATFGTVVVARRSNARGPGVAPAPLAARELEREITCPACGARMDVHPYFGPGNIVIDTCSQCDAIWLDRGELQQVSDAPGRDRGPERRR